MNIVSSASDSIWYISFGIFLFICLSRVSKRPRTLKFFRILSMIKMKYISSAKMDLSDLCKLCQLSIPFCSMSEPERFH